MSERELAESALTDDAAIRALRNRAMVEPLDLPPPSRRPRWVVRGLVSAVALLFVAIVVLAWREYLGPELQGEPPLVQAEPTPYKVEPSEPAQVQAGETPSRAVMRGSDLPPDRLAGRGDVPVTTAGEPSGADGPGTRDGESTLAADSMRGEAPTLDAAAAADTGGQTDRSADAVVDPEIALPATDPAATEAATAVASVDPLEPLDIEEPTVPGAPSPGDIGAPAAPPADAAGADLAAVPSAVTTPPIARARPGSAGSISADPIPPPDGISASDQPAPLAGVGELDAPAPAEPAAVPAVGEVQAALPSAPLPRPKPRIAATSRAEPASAPAARVEPAAGGAVWRVQVASMRDDQSARQAWDQVRARHPGLLAGLSPTIVRAEVGSGTFYRVQVGPFADRVAANATCSALKAERTDCLVVGPVR